MIRGGDIKKRQKEGDSVNMCGLALYFILETGVGGSHGEHFKIARPSGEI